MMHCQHCHTCGSPLQTCLDGEEWCPHCRRYRRYRSHGWAMACADDDQADACPTTIPRFDSTPRRATM